MRLCTLKAFRELIYAPGSEPSIATLRAKITKGKIPGGKFEDGRYWVDLDEFDKTTGLSQDIRNRIERLEQAPELEGLI